MRTALVGALLCLASGCFVPDSSAIGEKLTTECGVMPPAPNCACVSPSEGCDLVWERYAAERVQSQEEQECLLEMQCEPEDVGGNIAQIAECTSKASSLDLSGDPEPDCALSCDDALMGCGSEDACGVDVVQGCYAAYDTCLVACPRA